MPAETIEFTVVATFRRRSPAGEMPVPAPDGAPGRARPSVGHLTGTVTEGAAP
ncbi:hypothetical protein [Streptomyces sp. AHA2]|uniref:hypothetical protein n=1 Tax=Streptomyces sp. AHA2 TaxID=3064526 RepID=UPI002FE410D5